MAKSRLPGGCGMVAGGWYTASQTIGTVQTLAAAADRIILIGTVMWSDGGNHDCHTIRFRTGACSGVGTLRVGLRDIDTTNGPPGRDDGGVDGNDGTQINPLSTTVYSLALSADRTLNHGSQVAVVWDFSAWTSASVVIQGFSATSAASQHPTATFYNGSTYASTTLGRLPAVTLIDSTGLVYGTIYGAMPCIATAANTHAYAQDSGTADEYAMHFTVAQPLWCGGALVTVSAAADANFSIVLYEGTTAKATVAIDADTWNADAAVDQYRVVWPDVALTVGNDYYLAVKPTADGKNTTIYSWDVADAAELALIVGLAANYATRLDSGAWAAATTTRIPYKFQPIITAIDNAAGGVRLYGSLGGFRG